MNRFVIISGCSGGGKSTLLAALRRRGHATIAEPGRRIVAEERAGSGAALPWVDAAAFARRAVVLARADLPMAAGLPGWVFFDRSLIDAASALEQAGGPPLGATCSGGRYNPTVFMAPPWPEIYRTDESRRHGLPAAVAEYDRLLVAFARLGYRICLLPKASVAARADFVLERLGEGPR